MHEEEPGNSGLRSDTSTNQGTVMAREQQAGGWVQPAPRMPIAGSRVNTKVAPERQCRSALLNTAPAIGPGDVHPPGGLTWRYWSLNQQKSAQRQQKEQREPHIQRIQVSHYHIHQAAAEHPAAYKPASGRTAVARRTG